MNQAVRREFWSEQVRDYLASGLSLRSFSQGRKYSAESLRRWEKLLTEASREPRALKKASPFSAVIPKVLASPVKSPSKTPVSLIRLRLPMGVELESSEIPSSEWMADVLLRLRQGVVA